MLSYADFVTESYNCVKHSKMFKFSGTLEENESALIEAKKYIRSDCEKMSLLYCCINDFVAHNFCKSNNYTVVNMKDKLSLCKELRNITSSIKSEFIVKDCDVVDCIKKHSTFN